MHIDDYRNLNHRHLLISLRMSVENFADSGGNVSFPEVMARVDSPKGRLKKHSL